MFKSNTKPNFKYCISISMQNPNNQPELFLDKMRGYVWYNQCLFYLLSFYEL